MPALRVVAHPIDQVGAGGIADAVAVLLAPIVAAVAVAEEHVVLAVGVEHVRAGLRLIVFDAALDQVPVDLRPVDAVRGRRHADLVDRLGPAVDHLPLAAGDVPQVPGVVEAPDLRPAQHERLVRRIRQDRTVAELW